MLCNKERSGLNSLKFPNQVWNCWCEYLSWRWIEQVHAWLKKGIKKWITPHIFYDAYSFWRLSWWKETATCSVWQVYRWCAVWPPALTSFLSAGLGKSVCPVALFLWGLRTHVCARMCVYTCVCVCVFSVTLRHSQEVRWDWVWFLIPGRVDSCNVSHKCHDIRHTNRAQTHPHYLFFLSNCLGFSFVRHVS